MNKKQPIKVASLFSGIGGFETGIMNAFGSESVEVVFASEIDKHASKSYALIYGHQPHGDITMVPESEVPDHDLLVAGFPCQAFSISGRRLGFSDTRGTLFFEVARIAKEKQPKVLFLENVKGLVNHDGGKTLNTIMETLTEIGYRVDFKILDSKYFGVPQSRQRIYIIAVRNDLVDSSEWAVPKKTGLEAKAKKKLKENPFISTFSFAFPEEKEVRYTIEHILEEEVDEKFYLSEEKTRRILENLQGRHQEEVGKFLVDDQGRVKKKLKPLAISPTLRREMHGNEPRVVEPVMKMVGLLEMKGNDSIRRVYDAKGIAPTLTTMGGGHREPKVAVEKEHDLHTTYLIRKLTPLECFRLQHFPSSYYDLLKGYGVSDSQLYKMAGNAVTTSVIETISKKLSGFLKEESRV